MRNMWIASGGYRAQHVATGLLHILALAQQWTIAFDYSEVDALIATVKRTNALERSRAEFTLTMPDGTPPKR